ncbi:MAG: C1 family peptidase [Kiritimatiellia bacterium]
MKKMSLVYLWAGLFGVLATATSYALPNPAAAYAQKLGYAYAAANGAETVAVAPGVVLDAWDFYRGKVGSDYAYGAQYGYDTVNRTVESNGCVRSFAVCVPRKASRSGTTAEISMLDLMRQNGEPLWVDPEKQLPDDLEAILKSAPLKTFDKQALPTSWDWRNVGGSSYIGAVRNQGSCGSCYSFGAAAAAEGTFNYAMNRTGSQCVDFSEAYIAWCLGTYGDYSAHFSGCDGADYDYAELEALTVEGICGENQMPYNNGSDPGSCTYSGTTTVFEAWARVAYADIDAIKTAIMTYGVVDAAVYVDNAFDSYDGGVHDDSNNTCDSGWYTTSNHAISLVGWDDNPPEGGGGCWILRNSWGTSWGESGYMRIRYDAAVVHCAVCYMVYGEAAETPPSFTSGTSFGATTGVARTHTVTASGNPAPALKLQSTTASAGYYSFVTNTGVLTYQPPTNDVGSRTFTFTASNTQGVATQVVTATVSLAPPAAPAAIWASATNQADFTAAWSAVSGATGYRLDVGTNSSFSTGGGAGGTNLIAEGFASASPAGWTIDAGGTYSSSPYVGTLLSGTYSIKFGTTGESAVTPTFATGATNLQFWAYGNGGSGSTFAISGLVGSVWTLVDTVSIAANGATYNVALDPATTQIGFYYTKTYNVALDDVIVQASLGDPSFVPGYSNRTVAATSQSVTGLTAGATYYFRARAFNAAGASANSSAASVTTLATLSAPVFGANPGPVAATAGVQKIFTVGASGVPTPALALQSQTASGGYGFNAGSGELTYTPPQADAGARTFTFSATNSQGAAAQVVTVNVAAATAPAFTGGAGPYSTTVGVEVAFTVTASGTAPTLALAGQTASSGYSFTPATGAFAYTPPAGDVGTRTFTFTAANAAGTVTQVTSVAVSAVPTAPDAPAAVWASATNATDFTAAWSAPSGATSYRLDVGTNATFSAGGGSGGPATNCFHDGTLGNGTGGTWTETGLTQGSGYLVSQLGDSLTTPTLDFTASSSETLTFKARTYGGAIPANNVITVSISTDNGGNWTNLGTRTPLNTTLTAMTPFDLSAYDGAQVLVKLATLGATASVGAGIDDVSVTNVASSSTPSFVAGYSNRTVAGTSQSVTGLVAESTYFFRVRAVNDVGASGDSPTGSAATVAESAPGTPPTMAAIPAQTANVGSLFDYTATATATDGDPILSFGCTSAVDTNVWDFDVNTGYFVFEPTAAQLGTNLFSFTATDKDGASAPAQMSVRVYSAAASNEFTQWVEDQEEDPVDPDFAEGADVDGDGQTTYEEFLADTDPAASNSVLRLEGQTADLAEFSFPASPARYYQLEYCTDITNQAGTLVVSNLGWGVPGMVITNDLPTSWFGTIRVLLNEP